MNQANSIGKECVTNGGTCVEVSKCGACSNFATCSLKFPYECANNDKSNENSEKLICCPSSELI